MEIRPYNTGIITGIWEPNGFRINPVTAEPTSFEHWKEILKDAISQEEKEKRKEENKMADTNKILYVYEDIVSNRIREHYNKRKDEVEKESTEAQVAKKVKEFALKEIEKVFPNYDEIKHDIIVVNYNLQEQTKKIMVELGEERKKDLIKLDERITEIRAMLELAQTFDEKMQVLKAYEVVDKKGVIIK